MDSTCQALHTLFMLCCTVFWLYNGWFYSHPSGLLYSTEAIIQLPNASKATLYNKGKCVPINPEEMMIWPQQNKAQLKDMYILWDVLQ